MITVGVGANLDSFNRAFESAKERVEQTRRVIGELGSGSNETFASMVAHAESVSDSARALSESFGSFFKQFTAANLALQGIQKVTSAIRNAGSTIIDFQAKNSMLGAILGETRESMKEMEEQAKDLGRTTVFTASNVTELQIELSKLGFEKTAIQDMTESILQFAQATGGDLGDAAALTGAAIRMFGAQTDEANRYTNAMARATTASALNFQAIRDNLATFGPMAHAMGLEIEDVLALFGTLKNAGIEGSTAMTSLRNIFTRMSQGKIAGLEGGVKTLDEFVAKLKEIEGLEAGAAMKQVGTRGGTQFMTLIQQADTILELRDKIKQASADDTTGGMAKQMTDNVSGQIRMLESAWEGFVLSFSESTGVWKDFLELITKGVTALTNLVSVGSTIPHEVISGLMAGIGSLITIYGVKNGVQAVTTRLTAAETAQYERCAIALERANTMQAWSYNEELKGAVAKGVITPAIAEKITALLAEADAQIVETKAQRTATLEEIAAIDAEIAGLAPKIQSTDATIAEAAALEEKALIERKNRLETSVSSMTTKINTIEEEKNTVAKITNRTATQRLTDALKGMINPYLLAAAAIGGLVYVLVALHDSYIDAEKAQQMLNNAIEEHNNDLKEEEQKERENIRVIQDKNASLYEQYKAYKDLAKARGVFAKFTQEELKNMSQEQIDALFSMDNSQREKEMAESRLKAYEEFDRWVTLNGKQGVAWAVSGEAKKLKELQEKYNLGEELTSAWDETGSWSSVSNFASKMKEAAGDQLQDYLETAALSGVAAGLKRGMQDKEVQLSISQLLSNYNDQSLKLAEKRAKRIAEFDEKIKKASENRTDYTERNQYTKQKTSYEAEAKAAADALATQYKSQVQQTLSAYREEYEKLNKLLTVTSEGKKAEVEAKIKGTQQDIEFLESVISFFETGVKNQEVIFNVKTQSDIAQMSDESVISIGKEYENVQAKADEYLVKLQSISDKSEEVGGNWFLTTTKMAKDFGFTAESVEKDMDAISEENDKTLALLREKLRRAKTDAEKNPIRIEIEQREELLSYINLLRAKLLNATQNPYSINFAINFLKGKNGVGVDSLDFSQFFKGGGVNVAGFTKSLTDFIQGQQASRTSSAFTQAKADREYEAEVKEAEEAEKKKDKDDKQKAAAQRAAEQEAARRRKLAELERKKEEEQRKQAQKTYDAIEEARIASIIHHGERERNEQAEQHRLAIQAIDEEEREMKRKLFDYNKSVWEANNKDKTKSYYDTDEGKAGFEGLSLTDKEEEYIKAKREKENAEYSRILRERREEETKALNSYLKEYGNVEEQRLAITQNYERQISEAKNETERMVLQAQMRKALADFDFKQEGINFEEVFGNVGDLTVERLKDAKGVLYSMLQEGNLSAENYKTIVEQIEDINGQITEEQNKWKSNFGLMNDYVFKRKKLEMEVAEAQNQQAIAIQKQIQLQGELYGKQHDLSDYLKSVGVNKFEANDITVGNRQEILDSLEYDKDSDVYKNVEKALSGIAETSEGVIQANKTVTTTTNRVSSAEGKLTKHLADSLGKFKGFVQDFELVSQNIEGLPELAGALGIDEDSDAMKGFKGLADGANQAAGAFADFSSGNYVGAAVKAIGAVKSLGESIDGFTGGALFGSMKGYENALKKWEVILDTWRDTIEYEKKLMEKSYGSQLVEASDRAKGVAESAREGAEEIIKAYYSSGAGLFKHSKGYKENEQLDWSGLAAFDAEIASVLDRNAKNLTKLTGDQLEKLKNELPTYWSQIDDAVKTQLETIIATEDAVKELEKYKNELLTGTSFDSYYSQWKSMITDMSRDWRDMSQDFEEQLRTSILNSMMDRKYKKQIEALYEEWGKAAEDGITETEANRLRRLEKDLAQRIVTDRDQYVKSLGLDSSYSQQSTSRGVGQMSQETADELNGRFTALQISNDRISMAMNESLTHIQEIVLLQTAGNAFLSNIQTQVAIGNSHLEDMVKYAKLSYQTYTQKLDRIIEHTDKL